jgi:hypothetical protein
MFMKNPLGAIARIFPCRRSNVLVRRPKGEMKGTRTKTSCMICGKLFTTEPGKAIAPQLLFPLLLGLLSLGSGCGSHAVWNSPGPIQAIANSNELRLYIEMDRILARDFGPNDAPKQMPVGHIQELVIIADSGKTRRQTLNRNANKEDGFTFHPNNGLLFAEHDKFFLLALDSRDYRSTIFQWNGTRFEKLSADQSDQFLAEHQYSNGIRQTLEFLNQSMASNGWERVYKTTRMTTDTFRWNEREVKIDVVLHEETERWIVTIAVKDLDGFKPIVMEYSARMTKLNRREVKALPREERPHPR